MGSRISYYFDITRSATSFTLNADYHIDPYQGVYSRTDYSFEYTDSSGNLIDGSSGSAGATASVRDSFAFDTGPGVEVNRLDFAAQNSTDGYGFYFYWYVFDGARETTSQSIAGTNDTDIIFGGSAADTLRGLGDDDWLDGGAGSDTMYGGTGDDTYIVDNVRDRAIESANAGDDTVRSSVSYSLAGAANVETLALTGSRDVSATGNNLGNEIFGNAGDNRLVGGIGADRLFGDDPYAGGSGADTFQYRTIAESTVSVSGRDIIRDFSRAEGDHIDLHLIDAVSGTPGNQTFTFIGSDTFNHQAGELRSVISGASTYVSGDVNGDGSADFLIQLQGRITLNAGDFLL